MGLFWYRETGLISISESEIATKLPQSIMRLSNFFRFISPGSIRMDASSNRHQILVSAYISKESGDITLLMINRKSKDANAKIFLKILRHHLSSSIVHQKLKDVSMSVT